MVLGAAFVLPGCIEPINVGQETEAGSGGASETNAATDGMTSGSPTGSPTASGTDAGETDGTDGTDAGETDDDSTGDSCPPISIADCVQCECLNDQWACNTDACDYDCSDNACGDACMNCLPGDPECTDPDAEGICTADGQCVGSPPPKQGFCEGAIAPGFEADLDQTFGCSDMVVVAGNAIDTQAIVLSVLDTLVADAQSMGMPVHAEYAATDAALVLEARAGIMVTINECNDVVFPKVEIDELWLPTAGMVIIDVVPSGQDLGTATVELVDVLFERQQPGPAPILVPSLILEGLNVGWLPG